MNDANIEADDRGNIQVVDDDVTHGSTNVNVLSNNTIICRCALAFKILFTKLFDPCCKGVPPTDETNQ